MRRLTPGVTVVRRTAGLLLALGLAVATVSCKSPEPAAVLEVHDVETYWAVDPSSGSTQKLAPAVRFRLVNKSDKAQTSVQGTAVFRRKGEEGQTWGSDYLQAASRPKPLEAGASQMVILKSDARYTSMGAPEGMFQHAQWKDVVVDVFFRVGSSTWVKFASTPVERRIGTREAQEIASQKAPGGVPSVSPPPRPSPGS